MKIEGSLDLFPLRELIEMTVYSSVTGVININSAQHYGQIFFRDGQIYHAVYDNQAKGAEALTELFSEATASFAFVADIVAEEETLFGDVFDLMDTAERMAARWTRVRRLVPSMQVVPILICPSDQARFSISPEHWTIFTAIDSQRNISDIVAVLNVYPIEVCEAIAQMREDHLIELRQVACVQPAQTNASAQANASVVEQPSIRTNRPTSGILGRLMVNVSAKAERVPIPTLHSDDAPRNSAPSNEPAYGSDVDKILHLLRT